VATGRSSARDLPASCGRGTTLGSGFRRQQNDAARVRGEKRGPMRPLRIEPRVGVEAESPDFRVDAAMNALSGRPPTVLTANGSWFSERPR
jgi:hypothetical protein